MQQYGTCCTELVNAWKLNDTRLGGQHVAERLKHLTLRARQRFEKALQMVSVEDATA